MDKVKNESISFKIIDKTGKLVTSTTIKNRLLNNFLDYIIYYNLPLSIKNAVYPAFQPPMFDNNFGILSTIYVKFDTTQTITDSSTSMNYDIFSDTLSVEVPALYDGSKLTEVGFGVSDFANNPVIGINDYLMSYIDLSFLNITVLEGFILQFEREDLRTNNYIELDDPANHYANNSKSSFANPWRLEKIKFYYDLDRTVEAFNENVEDLTVVSSGIGEITISGFIPFVSNNTPALYPSPSTIPSVTTYPSFFEQMYAAEFVFENSSFVTPSYSAFINFEDVDATFENGTITIKYKYERGA